MERKKAVKKKATVPKEIKTPVPPEESALVVALREAITGAGRTHYAIAKEAGITPEILDRFVRGDRGMTLATAGKVADVLGYELTETAQKKAMS